MALTPQIGAPRGSGAYLKGKQVPRPRAVDMNASEKQQRDDIRNMDDPDLIQERRRLREELEHAPAHEISPVQRQRFRQVDDEFIKRARAAWSRAS